MVYGSQSFPTKGNLILAKIQLTTSRQGYELMDKRNILIRELMDLNRLKQRIFRKKSIKHSPMPISAFRGRISSTDQYSRRTFAYTVPIEDSIRIQTRSIMGTEIPKVKYEKKNTRPTYAFSTSRESIDIARDA